MSKKPSKASEPRLPRASDFPQEYLALQARSPEVCRQDLQSFFGEALDPVSSALDDGILDYFTYLAHSCHRSGLSYAKFSFLFSLARGILQQHATTRPGREALRAAVLSRLNGLLAERAGWCYETPALGCPEFDDVDTEVCLDVEDAEEPPPSQPEKVERTKSSQQLQQSQQPPEPRAPAEPTLHDLGRYSEVLFARECRETLIGANSPQKADAAAEKAAKGAKAKPKKGEVAEVKRYAFVLTEDEAGLMIELLAPLLDSAALWQACLAYTPQPLNGREVAAIPCDPRVGELPPLSIACPYRELEPLEAAIVRAARPKAAALYREAREKIDELKRQQTAK